MKCEVGNFKKLILWILAILHDIDILIQALPLRLSNLSNRFWCMVRIYFNIEHVFSCNIWNTTYDKFDNDVCLRLYIRKSILVLGLKCKGWLYLYPTFILDRGFTLEDPRTPQSVPCSLQTTAWYERFWGEVFCGQHGTNTGTNKE